MKSSSKLRCTFCQGLGRVPAPTSHDGLAACTGCNGAGFIIMAGGIRGSTAVVDEGEKPINDQ
jgi:hypothetical protein